MVISIFIYKITNTVNGKVYIGQSIRPIEQRFKRHINDAVNNYLDTHFARAIRKYGKDNFCLEQIDTATTQNELNEKEQYWITYYNATVDGYNETDAVYKCGGNTYKNKTNDEMIEISNKLSNSKLSDKNPNAKKIKCLNVITGEELLFNTVKECQEYFSENTHRFITTRVTNQTKSLYKGIWNIAYLDSEYKCLDSVNKKGVCVSVENLETHIVTNYESIRLACRECDLNRSVVNSYLKQSKEFIINNHKFTVLN